MNASDDPSAPSGQSWFGNVVILAFLLTQLTDGALTYVGMTNFGTQIEANPILAWYVGLFGTGVAVVAAKIFATSCGVTLHLYARHRALGALTIVYLVGAVAPWVHLLLG